MSNYSKKSANTQPKLKIIVVDHHDECLHSMSLLLRLWGHQVFEAHNALEAIRISHEHMPDAITFELDLPGISGYELATHFLQSSEDSLKRPLLIAVTSYGGDEDRQATAKLGIDWHLLKPVDPTELEAMFSECLQRRSQPPTPDRPAAGKSLLPFEHN